MAMAKKNYAAASTKNSTPQLSNVKKEQTSPQSAVKKELVTVPPEAKPEPKRESPLANENISETSVKESNGIIILALPLLGAVWYMICLIVIL